MCYCKNIPLSQIWLSGFFSYNHVADNRLIILLVRGRGKWWKHFEGWDKIRTYILLSFLLVPTTLLWVIYIFLILLILYYSTASDQFPLLYRRAGPNIGNKLTKRYDETNESGFLQIILYKSFWSYLNLFFPSSWASVTKSKWYESNQLARVVWSLLKVFDLYAHRRCICFVAHAIIFDCLFASWNENDSAKMAARINWKCQTLLLITVILWLNAANCQQQTGN